MKSWLEQEELPPIIYKKTGSKSQPAQGHTGEKAKNQTRISGFYLLHPNTQFCELLWFFLGGGFEMSGD